MAAYGHMNTNTSALLQKGTTLLNKVVVNNTGSAWVITIYDGVDNTGTVVAALSASNGGNYDFECTLTKGLYVVTSGTTAGDCTIVFD